MSQDPVKRAVAAQIEARKAERPLDELLAAIIKSRQTHLRWNKCIDLARTLIYGLGEHIANAWDLDPVIRRTLGMRFGVTGDEQRSFEQALDEMEQDGFRAARKAHQAERTAAEDAA